MGKRAKLAYRKLELQRLAVKLCIEKGYDPGGMSTNVQVMGKVIFNDSLSKLECYQRLDKLHGSHSAEIVPIRKSLKPVRAKKIIPLFYSTKEWRTLRYEVLLRDYARCQCCGASKDAGFRMNVDHIIPRHIRPDLAMEISNLQTLCAPCNEGKGGWDRTDWRLKEGELG